MNVLLIDDDTIYAESLMEILFSRGHQVTYCKNMIDFHQVMNIERHDLALLDLMLPPTYTNEGLSILSKLKKTTPDMYVIMISQKNEKMISVVAKAFLEGSYTFLDKNDCSLMERLSEAIREIECKMRNKIFISYGHNELLKLKLKEFIRERVKREIIILDELPNRGLTIVEKLEKASAFCNCAIVLLTKDDEIMDGGMRPRQNVIHEIGFFQGKYGRNKVILLCERGVELLSNISGIMRIEFDVTHFEAVYDAIRMELDVINERGY